MSARVALALARRVCSYLVALLLVFLAVDLLPGGPAAALLGPDATPGAVADLEHRLGLDRPVLLRFVEHLGGLLTGDLGTTLRGESIGELVEARLPATLLLALGALVLAGLGAVAGGSWWALRARRRASAAVEVGSAAVLAVPEFVIGTMAIVVFGLVLNVLPAVTATDATGRLASPDMIVLPLLTLVLPQLAWNLRVARAAVAEAAGLPHVDQARLDGVDERAVVWRHVLPCAAPTIVTSLAVSAGSLVGGTLVVETLFNYPGVGALVASSVAARDSGLLFALTAVTAALIMALLTVADIVRVLAVRGRR